MPYKSKQALRKYRQRYRETNREDLNSYLRRRRQDNRVWAIEQLGGKCVRCGAASDLHFDHVDPDTKLASIGKILNRSREQLREEIAKCQLLCEPCHRQKTINGHEYKKPAQHGGATMYTLHRCRCEACRLWKRNYDMQWKLSRSGVAA